MKGSPRTDPLTPERRDLAAAFLPLAKSVAREFGRATGRRDGDLKSQAYLILVGAALDYDPSRGVAFATFARFLIEKRLRRRRREAPPFEAFVSLDGRLDSRMQATFEDAIARIPANTLDEIDAAEDILKHLPARHAAALRLVCLEDLTQQQAAERLGCSQAEVSRLVRQSRTLLAG